jgi:hypothetical protein
MVGTAINISRGFSSIAPVAERTITVEDHASDLVGNSTVRTLNFAIEVRGISASCIESELGLITNERAKQRGASQRSIFVNTNSIECALFATKMCEEPTNDMNRRFLAGSTKVPDSASLGVDDGKHRSETAMRYNVPKSEIHMQ